LCYSRFPWLPRRCWQRGFDPGLKNHEVQAVPYSGGKPKTLVGEAFELSWNR